jgi:hypothetical protein
VANIKQGILTGIEIKGIRKIKIVRMTAQYVTKFINSKYKNVKTTP